MKLVSALFPKKWQYSSKCRCFTPFPQTSMGPSGLPGKLVVLESRTELDCLIEFINDQFDNPTKLRWYALNLGNFFVGRIWKKSSTLKVADSKLKTKFDNLLFKSASMQWGWRGRRLKTRGSSSGKESAVPAQTLTQPLPRGQTGNFLQPQNNYKPKCVFFQEGRFNSCDSERALCLHGDRSDIGCQWALVTRQL